MLNKTLFKVEHMEVDKIQNFNITKGSTVSANGVIYEKDIISKIEVVKRKFDGRYRETFFIHLFMGNFQLGSIVAEEDYIIEFDEDTLFPRLDIRKAENYDYKDSMRQEEQL